MLMPGPGWGALNPNAPPELSLFAFVIGAWQCQARIKLPDGAWHPFHATWVGRFVLDGYAIADEYRMTSLSGELIVLGVNLRAYDTAAGAWNIKWLSALTGRWADLGPEELGGVRIEGESIIYAYKEPAAPHAFTRAVYTNITAEHFTWRGESSEDGTAWDEFMVVECERQPD